VVQVVGRDLFLFQDFEEILERNSRNSKLVNELVLGETEENLDVSSSGDAR
jgi:hypothetical protein